MELKTENSYFLLRKFFCIEIYQKIGIFIGKKNDIYILVNYDIVYIIGISINIIICMLIIFM